MRHTLLRTAELTKGYIRGVLPRTQWHRTLGRRCVQISATPSDASPALDNLTPAPPSSPADSPGLYTPVFFYFWADRVCQMPDSKF